MTEQKNSQLYQVAEHIASRYSQLPQVEAVAIAGSQTFNTADQQSDIDLYIYVRAEIPVDLRASIANRSATRVEVNNQFWEAGDEWVDADLQISVDAMFRKVSWIEAQLDRVLVQHQASVGYSTCFWHNVLSSRALYDRQGWFDQLQQLAKQPYPQALKQAIIAKNYPILQQTISSYLHQLQLAATRHDLVGINHRIAALLASYFDILFALNELPHPGEKRLVAIATEQCPKKPVAMSQQVNGLIKTIGQDPSLMLRQAEELVTGLTQLLKREGYL